MYHTLSYHAGRMIIGHVGVAFGARRRWQRVPMGWLLGATFAPDIWRLALAGSGYGWWPSNTLSHALPWSAVIAVVLGSLAWVTLHDGPAALVVAALVASHVALDMVSGWKPLWIGGPNGLNMQHVEQVEFVIEALLATTGWRLLRNARRPGWLSSKSLLLIMLAFELTYLHRTYSMRQESARCMTYPFSSCWRRL